MARATPVLLLIALSLLSASSVFASEVDNYSMYGYQPVEVIDSLNENFNHEVQAAIQEWHGPESSVLFAEDVHRRLQHRFLTAWDQSWYGTEKIPFFKYEQH